MMGSPSPVASKVRKESPSSSNSKVRPHGRTSSVASSCELGDQDGQSPGRSNGLGKSPVAVSSSSPRTPAGPEKSGSPAALKKRRASIGSPDDLARGLDFGSSSPSTDEKKHPFLIRGGGHKKVAAPAAQSSSPGKKPATPPGKEKLVTGRATAPSGLSPMKSVEAKKDFTSSGRSVLASESSSTNESLISEVTSGWVAKKASPRASLDSKISAMKSSPRSKTKPVAITKGRTNSNGEEAAIRSSVESLNAETKSSLGKSPDVKLRKSSSVSPLNFKAGLTSPKSSKLAKTRQDSPSLSGRVMTRVEKAEQNEDLHTPELASVAVSMENATVTMSGDVSAKKEEGLSLLPSLMLDGNVGDEDMSSLNQGSGDPGFDNDMEMPTSWLSEDLPCMFSSLSRLPEPDDSSSSLLGDPPEVLDDPELASPSHFQTSTAITSKSPKKNSKEEDELVRNNGSSSFGLTEESGEAEDELEPRQTLLFSAVVAGSNIVPSVTESVAYETSLQLLEKPLTGTQSSQVTFESRGTQPVSSQTVEVPTEVITLESSKSSELLDLSVDINAPTAIPALREEEIHPATEDETQAAENHYMIESSDDESSEDFNDDSCSAQLNLKQSFDAAAEPAVPHNDVDEEECDMLAREDTCNLASALSTNTETLPEVTRKTELEFAGASQDGEEPTEVDQDMMIFDFEEHWALNAGDESCSSGASQNGAEELQSREASLPMPVQDEVAKSLPANFPASNSSQTEECEEVFHSFESSKVETNLSSPSELTVQHNLEPLAPISSQSKIAGDTEHSNAAVYIGQVGQNVDMPNGKDEEVEVAEHQNSSVHTLLVQNSSVADLPISTSNLLWSNTKATVDEHESAREDVDIPPVLAVSSNDLLSTNVQHFDDSTHASYQSVVFPLQVASQKSSFETPAQPEARMTDHSVDIGSENVSKPGVFASAATKDDRLAVETESQTSPNRDVTSETGELINSEVNSPKLLMVESDGKTLDSSAGGEEVDPLESNVLKTGISEEEQTEAAFLLSLESREESGSTLNKDSSIPDQKLQTNLSQGEPQGRTDIIKVTDPGCIAGDEGIPQPKAELFNMSSESKEDELEAPELSDLQILSKGMFSVEEKPVDSKYQEDEKTSHHALQMELSGDMANESEVHHQPQIPLINTPETLMEDKESQSNVPTENGLPKEESHVLMSVSCSPVLDKEDEILIEKIDSKFKVESTASVDEADEGTDTVITTAGAAVSDATSSAEIFAEGEAVCNTDEVTPVSRPARNFSSLGHKEVEDTDDKLGNKDTVSEERKENVSDLEEQSTTAVHGWEEPPLVNYTSDSNSSIEDPMDTLHEEVMVTNTISPAVVDDTIEDFDIHTSKPEETLRSISTTDEKIECHDHTFQENQLPSGAPLPTDDQVSKPEVALEKEEVFMSPTFDGSDDLAVKGVETVPENVTSQEPLVAIDQLTGNTARSEVDEKENTDQTWVTEGEDLNSTLESIPVLKEKGSVVDIGQNMNVDERAGISAAQVTPPPEMYTFGTFFPENSHSVSPGQHSTKETLLEDDKTVVYSPVKIFVASGTPGTTVLGDVSVETLSPISRNADKETESLNGDFEEESVLENALVHSPEDKADFGAQKSPNATDGIHTAENGEESFLQEKSLLQNEISSKEFTVVSRDETPISGVDDMEEHLWKGGKEKESSSGNLEGDEDIPLSQLKSPAEETPKSTISEVVKSHSNNACNGESFHGTLKEESMLEDEDTVVYRPTVEDFPMERTSSSKDVETVMDSHVESFNALDDTELNRPSVKEPAMEGSVPEGVKKVVNSHKEMVGVPDQDTTSIASLVVGEEETLRDDKEEESLNGSMERECKLEVEERPEELLVAPDFLNTTNKSNSNLVVADELEKQTVKEVNTLEPSSKEKSTFEAEDSMVESSEKESVVPPDLQNATNTSNLSVAKEMEKQSVEEEMTLEQIPEKRSSFEVEKKVMVESSENESSFAPDLSNASYTSILEVAEKPEKQTIKEEETLDRNSETKPMVEVEETVEEESSEEKSIITPGLESAPNTSNLDVADELEKKQTDKENEALGRSLEETVVNNTQQTCVSSDLLNEKTSNMVVELKKQTDTNEETTEEKPMLVVEERVVESSKKPFVASDAATATLDAENLDKHPTWKTFNKEGESLNGRTSEEESIQDTIEVSSNEDVKTASISEAATQEPHESDDQTADIVKNSLNETVVAKTDTCAEDLEKSSITSAVAKESCMTNGEKHNVPVNMQDTTAPTESISEPQSPTATLYPLSRPPFSGSQQDRLWEEQAEAYNSGQGTPSRNGASGVSSSPNEKKLMPSEDQIQPVAAAAAAANGNHAVIAGPSSHENGSKTLAIAQSKGNGKEKLHTPLRSLLLEDVLHRDPILTPNGVSSSPSFIRRLFRVVSTSSRGSDREVPQAKLKRSASMWVSCLGAPQVQQ